MRGNLDLYKESMDALQKKNNELEKHSTGHPSLPQI